LSAKPNRRSKEENSNRRSGDQKIKRSRIKQKIKFNRPTGEQEFRRQIRDPGVPGIKDVSGRSRKAKD
jgi:hypothetical protein